MNNNYLPFILFALGIPIAAFGQESPTQAETPKMELGDVFRGIPQEANGAATLKSGAYAKVAPTLFDLEENYRDHLAIRAAARVSRPFEPSLKGLSIVRGYVAVDATATGDAAALESDLLGLGAINVESRGRTVSARVPVTSMKAMAGLDSLRFVRPYVAITHVGDTTSQGDVAQASDLARAIAPGYDGTGVAVGVMSDSYDCAGILADGRRTAAEDVTSGDLPVGVNVLLEEAGCGSGSDEGRAMMQIVYDVAPGSSLAFHTAFGGQAVFANGIDDLVAAGVDVIVDDVFNFGEPMFQDGIIAQAANDAAAAGVPYFSSAGNSAQNSYESPYNDSGLAGVNALSTHDFDPGPGVSNLQALTIPVGAGFTMSFQWDQPFASLGGAGATTDLDIYVIGADGVTPLTTFEGASDNLASGDALEVFSFNNTGFDLDGVPGNDTTFYLLIENFAGPNPSLIKYAFSGSGISIDTFDSDSGPSYGHASAAGAASVAAAAYTDTPAFGTDPPELESFSSRANVPILFTPGGSLVPPELRVKPDITAPDGVNTTFFGSPDFEGDGFLNFFGTSAAAPHAAGAAALMLEYDPALVPEEIYSAMRNTGIDIGAAGFDFDSGFGLIQVDDAIGALANDAPVLDPVTSQTGSTSDVLVFSLNATDANGNNLSFSQTGMPEPMCALTDAGDGTGDITCTIAAGDQGRTAVVVTATDDGAPPRAHSRGFYVTANPNSAPVLAAIGLLEMDDGTTLNVPISASDPDGNPLVLTGIDIPGFCSFVDNTDGTADLDCDPGFNNSGSFFFSVVATDDRTPNLNDGEFTALIVNNVNRNPVLDPIGPQSVNEGEEIIISGGATDPDVPDVLTLDSNEPEFCVGVDNGDGTGTLTCNPTFEDAGAYDITVTVEDAFGGGDFETFTLTVIDVNRPPTVDFIGNQVIANNDSLVINVSASDADGNNVQLSGAVPGFCVPDYSAGFTGTITCNPTGPGDNGTYPVTITATDDGDGSLTGNESFDIVVGEPGTLNTAPVLAVIGDQSVVNTGQLVIPLSSSDADGDSMTFSDTSGLPPFCVLNDGNGTGNITCTPGLSDLGDYPVSVRVTDDGVPPLSDGEAISISVFGINTGPLADAGPDQEVVTPELVFLDGSNSTDAETASVDLDYEWRLVAKAPGSNLGNDQIFDRFTSMPSFIPDVDGAYTLELTVTDELLDADVDTVTIFSETPKILYFGDELNNRISPRSTADGSALPIPFTDVAIQDGSVSGVSAVAVNPQTNEMFVAVERNNIETTRWLASVDPLTGNETIIGDMGDLVQGMVFDSAGTLYAVTDDDATTPETLFTVDLVTGAMTFEQALGNGDQGDSISYSPDADALFHTSGFGTSIFESIDLEADTTTDIPYSGDLTGLFLVFGLAYDETANGFVGTMANGSSGNIEYFTLTPSGIVSTVSTLDSFEWRGHAFWDLDFQPPANLAAAGDLGGDRKADIQWHRQISGEVALWQMDGNVRQVNSGIATVSDEHWRIVGQGDYDGDGTADTLLLNVVSGEVVYWRIVDGQRVASKTIATLGDTNWQVFSDGDFNGDGRSDVMWRNIATGAVAYWEMNGGSIVLNVSAGNVSNTDWRIVGDGDMNGDGKADLLWWNFSTGGVALWQMDAATRLFNFGLGKVSDLDWRIVGNADFNGDGFADILWRNSATGENAMWLMSGSTRIANVGLLSAGVQWQVIGDNDYDGDGKADILWRNPSSGKNALWRMDGATRLQNLGVPAVFDAEWIPVNVN